MKCTNCGQENKDAAKSCRKCGRDLAVPPAWFPDARWHLRTLGVIYALLIGFYFSVNALLAKLPRPYHLREIPPEMTPWLRKGPKHLPEEALKAPEPPAPAAPAAKKK